MSPGFLKKIFINNNLLIPWSLIHFLIYSFLLEIEKELESSKDRRLFIKNIKKTVGIIIPSSFYFLIMMPT